MALAITYSRANIGILTSVVTVETHISKGLPRFNIVGLPETAVKESKDRVRSAIINSHFEFPYQRITVNLGPADLPKHGGRYDLAIALGILAASNQFPKNKLVGYEFAGELALTGELRPISGALPFALGTKNVNKTLILPIENIEEAGLISQVQLLPARNLLEVCSHLLGKSKLEYCTPKIAADAAPGYQDLKEVKGQHHAKRALEIAAAGQHSLLLIGPPGVGKTLLSHCLPGILPPMTEEEAVELAAIQSIANMTLSAQTWKQRPFRAPHHSASSYALIGGGNPPKPGEISLAHNGVLFLDELPEFKRQALEVLREPLESGIISIARATHQVQYPAKFQLIAAMNPCPCGHFGNRAVDCICPTESIKRYQARISGPLLDRIDIQASLQHIDPFILTKKSQENIADSRTILERVVTARRQQTQRAGKVNAMLSGQEVEQYCHLGNEEINFFEIACKKMNFSARSFHKVLKMARTIADLEQATTINCQHLKEAFSFRHLERMKIA